MEQNKYSNKNQNQQNKADNKKDQNKADNKKDQNKQY